MTTLPNGKTAHVRRTRATRTNPYTRLYRSDDVATGVPVVHRPDEPDAADPGYATYNLCTGQCWYDLFVYTPKGYPDIVYAGGSYSYGETAGSRTSAA